jgi:hypothetical protein
LRADDELHVGRIGGNRRKIKVRFAAGPDVDVADVLSDADHFTIRRSSPAIKPLADGIFTRPVAASERFADPGDLTKYVGALSKAKIAELDRALGIAFALK